MYPEPSIPPKHVTESVWNVPERGAGGSDTVAAACARHPFASVIITEYDPAATFCKFGVVNPLDHRKE
jgi:hypothetical protein